jgi:tetraacyldisaccharide 4'-kinase
VKTPVLKAPVFWRDDGVIPAVLSPLAALYARATARRVARPGWRAPVPVLCCGNAGAGGAGKTTVALDFGERLAAKGMSPAFLTRGYGGRVTQPVQVRPGDEAAYVGDEALLLAAVAPTFVCADRAAGARAAVDVGARALVMDDGLQNPSLAKDFSILVIDGGSGFGNGRVIPAGPLREPVAAAAARCQAAVLIGRDVRGARMALPPDLPVLLASLTASPEAAALAGRSVLAFAGIGRPAKFFETLEACGAHVALRREFPDHHPYSMQEIQQLLDEAARIGANPVTTPKDAVRLPAALRDAVRVVGVRLAWEDEAAIDALLTGVVAASR